MANKKFIWISIIAIIIITGIIIFFYLLPTEEEVATDKCKELGIQQSIDSCYWSNAIDRVDSSFCYLIKEVKLKSSCFLGIAQLTSDGKWCGEISATDLFESTGVPQRDNCYVEIAIKNKDISLCDKMITTDSVFWDRQKCKDAIQNKK